MGLAAREIEAAGIATVTLSMVPELTSATGAPRTAGIGHPMSRPLGNPNDGDGQRSVLQAALQVVESAQAPQSVIHLPFEWPESPRKARTHPPEPPPIGRLLKKKPWLLPKLISGDIPV